ncbi:unnamed protein product [Calypogeia fissa]
MAVLGAPVEVLRSSSVACCSHSFLNDHSAAAASSSRVALANCRGEVFGNPVLSSSKRCSRNRSGDVTIQRGWPRLRISAIDAAQEFDYESLKLTELQKKKILKVGIVGFGNFGQFLAQRFVKQGHNVLAFSRSDYSDCAKKLGVTYYRDADDFCEEHPEVVVLCTSILSTDSVLHSLPVQRLKRNTLFVDVLSVKEFPRNLFLEVLPTEFDILCTHPMFGPESGRGTWQGLPFVFEKVRIRESRTDKCNRFLNLFASEGCRMVEMSCKEHDRHAAGSQFITHTVGRVLGCLGLESTPLNSKGFESSFALSLFPSRVLGSLGLESTPINTKGYESLLKLVENTYSDSFDLYYGLFLYNVNATEELVRLERAFDVVKSQLFDKLHTILREQLLKSSSLPDVSVPIPPAPTLKALTTAPADQILDISGLDSERSDNNASPALAKSD